MLNATQIKSLFKIIENRLPLAPRWGLCSTHRWLAACLETTPKSLLMKKGMIAIDDFLQSSFQMPVQVSNPNTPFFQSIVVIISLEMKCVPLSFSDIWMNSRAARGCAVAWRGATLPIPSPGGHCPSAAVLILQGVHTRSHSPAAVSRAAFCTLHPRTPNAHRPFTLQD